MALATLPPGIDPRYPLERRLGGSQSRSRRGWGREKFPASSGKWTPPSSPP